MPLARQGGDGIATTRADWLSRGPVRNFVLVIVDRDAECLSSEGRDGLAQGPVVPDRAHDVEDGLGSSGGVLLVDDQVRVGGAGDDLLQRCLSTASTSCPARSSRMPDVGWRSGRRGACRRSREVRQPPAPRPRPHVLVDGAADPARLRIAGPTSSRDSAVAPPKRTARPSGPGRRGPRGTPGRDSADRVGGGAVGLE